MLHTRASRPGRALDDDWLFTDPMVIELEDADEPEPWPAHGAPACLRRVPRRWLWLACTLVLASSATAGVMLWRGWEARLTNSALPCAHGHALRGDVSPAPPDKS